MRFLASLAAVGLSLLCLAPVRLAGKPVAATARRLPPVQQANEHFLTLLDPAEDSDLDLPRAVLELDGNQTRVRLSRPARDAKPVFVTVDVAKRQYHAYELSDAKKDAARVATMFGRAGAAVAESVLMDRFDRVLQEHQQLKAASMSMLRLRLRESVAAAAGPISESGPYVPATCSSDASVDAPPCVGTGWARVDTYEPAAYFFPVETLTHTRVDVQYERNGLTNFKSVLYKTGDCWANPFTFAFTTWFTNDCIKPPVSYYENNRSFDATTIGDYFNYDFMLDAHAIQVIATVFCDHPSSNVPIEDAQTIYINLGPYNFYESLFLSSLAYGNAYEICPQGFDCDISDDGLLECENQSDYHYWDYEQCSCLLGASPLLIDIDGDGLNLTGYQAGVTFDLMANGAPIQVGWTAPGARDAFVVLDRNHNGSVDDGTELFGNFSPQPHPPQGEEKNGFRALAVYDRAAEGGNGDGKISSADSVYSQLQLWFDVNHDGVSQPDELFGLAQAGVREISLNFKKSKISDDFNNAYRYRSEAKIDTDLSDRHAKRRLVFDVYFAHEK